MFGKLLKNDLKAHFFSVFPILVIMAVGITALEIWHYVGDGEAAQYLSGLFVSLVFLFSCLIMIIAVSIMFNRSVFDSEGYLTLSLPVKTQNLVFSKMVSGLIWVATPFVLFMVSLFVYALQMISEFEEEVEMGDMLLQLLGAPSIDVILVYIFIFCLDLVVSIVLVVQCIYFGITLSHVSPISKLGKFGAIVFTVATLYVLSELIGGVAEVLKFGLIIDVDSYFFTDNVTRTIKKASEDAVAYNLASSTASLLFSLGLNIPIVYLIKNKVNI